MLMRPGSREPGESRIPRWETTVHMASQLSVWGQWEPRSDSGSQEPSLTWWRGVPLKPQRIPLQRQRGPSINWSSWICVDCGESQSIWKGTHVCGSDLVNHTCRTPNASCNLKKQHLQLQRTTRQGAGVGPHVLGLEDTLLLADGRDGRNQR